LSILPDGSVAEMAWVDFFELEIGVPESAAAAAAARRRAAAAGQGATLRATDARWIGRTQRDEAAGSVAFAWEGTQAQVVVSGATTVSATLHSAYVSGGGARFRVLLNGTAQPDILTLAPGQSEGVLLVGGLLPAETYVVTLWSITDPITMTWPLIDAGFVTALHFDVDAGAFLPPQPAPTRRVRIIGDSITAGNQNVLPPKIPASRPPPATHRPTATFPLKNSHPNSP